MNQKKNIIQRMKWTGLLTLLLMATYPIGLYFNIQKLGIKIKAATLPHMKLNLGRLRFKIPNGSAIKIRSTSN